MSTEKRRTLGPPAAKDSNGAESGFFAILAASDPRSQSDREDQDRSKSLHHRPGNPAVREN
jgi:hypothetical protein